MDLHFPRERVRSVRDFILRYLLIVAGILTALGVGQWNENRKAERLAAEAESAIREELTANAKDLRESIATNDERLAQLRPIIESLREKKTLAEARAWLKTNVKAGDITLGVSAPTLRRAAWQTATSTGAVRKMKPETLREFAMIYSAQEDIGGISAAITPHMFAGVLDVLSSRDGDASLADLRRGLMAVGAVNEVLGQNHRELLKQIEETLGSADATHAPQQPPADSQKPSK
jgi:hypothetical protein